MVTALFCSWSFEGPDRRQNCQNSKSEKCFPRAGPLVHQVCFRPRSAPLQHGRLRDRQPGQKVWQKWHRVRVNRKVQRRLQIWKFEFDESWSALTGVQKIDAHFTHRPSCNAQCLREASLHHSRRVDTGVAGVRLCEVGLRSARFRRSSEGCLRKSLYEN